MWLPRACFGLLTTTAIVAPAYAADVNITSPGTFNIAAGQSVEFQAEQGATTSSYAQVGGGVVIGSVNATAANIGVLSLVGDGAGVNGSVNNLFRITMGGSGAMSVSGDVTNTGAFYTQAATLTVGGNFQNSYVNFTNNRDGTLILNGASNSVSSVLMTGSTGILGTITLGAGSDTTFTGAVGGSARVKRLDLNGTLATFNGNINAASVNFGADGGALVRGSTVTAPFTTSVDNTGTLRFGPGAQTTVNGTIGSSSHALKRVGMESGTGSVVRLTGAVFANEIGIDGLGTLIIDTASSLDTSAGSAGTGPSVLFSRDGLMSLVSTGVRIGRVTTLGGTAGQGRISFTGAGIYTFGTGIAADDNRLSRITISNAATTVETAALSDNYVSTVHFSADATLYLNDGSSLTGDVTTGTNRRGTVVYRGGAGTVLRGNVGSGSAQIKAFEVGGYGDGAVEGNIYAQTVAFAGAADAELRLSGNIFGTVEGAAGGGGRLTFATPTATGGIMGAASALRSVAFQGAGVSTLNHDINAGAAGGTGVLIGSGAMLQVGVSDRTITGSLTNHGTLNLGLNRITVAGNISGTGTIAFSVGAAGTGYIVNTASTANYAPGFGNVTIVPTVVGTTVADGSLVAFIRGATAGIGPDLALANFTIAGTSGLTWTVTSGAAHIGAVDLNGHTITAADTILIAGPIGANPPNPGTPTPPEAPGTPTVPEAPGTPTIPDNPGTPSVPETPSTPANPGTPPPVSHVIDTTQPYFSNGDAALQGDSLTFAGGELRPGSALNLSQQINVTAANGALNLNGFTVTFSSQVTGDGSLTIDGNGALVVAGNLSNAGGLVVQGAELIVAGGGRIAAPLFVETGGILSGTGTIAAPSVVAGVLSPGNSPGTLTFAGPLALAGSSTYRVEIDGPRAGTGAGAHDRVILSGSASSFTAGGTLSPILRGISGDAANTYTPGVGQTFRVVEAEGGILGQFDALTQPASGLAAGTRFDVLYGDSAVVLAVTPQTYGDLAASGLSQTAAGRAAGSALDRLRPAAGTRLTGAAASFYDTLYTLSGAQAAHVTEQLAGTIHADLMATSLLNSRLFGRVVEARQAAARGDGAKAWGGALAFGSSGSRSELIASTRVSGAGEPATATGDQRFTAWVKPLVSWGRTASDSRAIGSNQDSGGVMVGGEIATDGNVTAGLSFGYLHGNVKTITGGTGTVDNYQTTLYATWSNDSTFFDAALSYGFNDYDTTRTLSFGGFGGAAEGASDGHSWSAEIGLGHRIRGQKAWLEPRAGLRWDRIERDGFSETGLGQWSLSIGSETVTALRSALGVRGGTTLQLGSLTVEPAAHLAWEHDFKDIGGSGQFGMADAGFRINGAEPGRNAAVVGLDLGFTLSTMLRATLDYTGEFREGRTSHTASAGLRLAF